MNSDATKPIENRRSEADTKPTARRRSTDSPKPVENRRSRRSVIPYNPGLQKLLAGKQAWAEPLDAEARARGFRGWHQRGYLPHYDAPGLTQFVTFRLADAMPVNRRGEWEALLKIEPERQRRIQLEDYLDRGLGECWLGRPEIAEITENALHFFDGQRYQLQAWVVVPNHVHVVVDIWQTPLAQVAQSWKRFIAREANKRLKRAGPFWEREYWDTWIRDEAHCRKALHYLETNPVKAGLARTAADWRWTSAQLRDEYGALKRPETEGGAPT